MMTNEESMDVMSAEEKQLYGDTLKATGGDMKAAGKAVLARRQEPQLAKPLVVGGVVVTRTSESRRPVDMRLVFVVLVVVAYLTAVAAAVGR
jgi:hypothetical protein